MFAELLALIGTLQSEFSGMTASILGAFALLGIFVLDKDTRIRRALA